MKLTNDVKISLTRFRKFSFSKILFPTFDDIKEAQKNISSHIISHNFSKLQLSGSKNNVFLKMENMQMNNSYKIRGALNCLLKFAKNNSIPDSGFATASSGNFALQMAYSLKLLSLQTKLTLAVPVFSSLEKLQKIRSIYSNLSIVKLSPEDWIQIILRGEFDLSKFRILEGEYDPLKMPLYISTATNFHVMAGSGTIGLEIVENLNQFGINDSEKTCIIIPYGGGGLTISVSIAMQALHKNIKFFSCEIENAAPLKASLNKGKPALIEYTPSFVDGIGSITVIPDMFEKVRNVIIDSLTVNEKEAEESLKLIYSQKNMIVEGAAACSLAAYLKYKDTILSEFKNVICILSGGNIEKKVFEEIIKK
jgi:threonine dehydratase